MLRWAFISLLVILIGTDLKAQLSTNRRSKKITSSRTVILLDSLSIVPQSFAVKYPEDIAADTSLYTVDYAKATFLWKGAEGISLNLHYKVFPMLFSKTYRHKDIKRLEQSVISGSDTYVYKPQTVENTLFSMKGLHKSGSISRGIMFGNNQNLSVNSNMVLQMSGKIANDIEILAAISDDNLPIQPEGNTQQLNEFDRVFVQIKKDSTVLTAGDYELKRPDSYFMNFYKRTQGAMINHQFKTENGIRFSTTVAAAVAKGRSARNQIMGQEGNQGPYRLTGNNGETYIVVIAGTERVYIDGVPLLRGQDNDYVIDYNTAEITFTAKQLINLNTRISVEFEYSDKNYSRSLTYLNQRIEKGQLAFRLNYYNEKDNRNQPFLQTLTDAQKQFMASLGQNISQAYYPNVTEVPFNENEILYERLLSTGGIEYYRYSTDPAVAKYRVGFSYVGDGKGNYRINHQSAANGKVYEFVEPVGGVLQGNYEPITLLVTPKQQQLITVAADYKPQKQSVFSSEFAISNNNVNLFADKRMANVTGQGLKLDALHPFELNQKGLKLNTSANYEYVSKTFKPIERYRMVEFNRDFNLDALTTPATEHLFSVGAQLYNNPLQNISYTLSTFSRETQYQGYLHKVNGLYKQGRYGLKYDGSLLKSDATVSRGTFFKHYLEVNREIFGLLAGFVFEQQHNLTSDKQTDVLTGSSFSYHLYKWYLQSKAGQSNRYKLDYSYRQDQLPRGTQLLNSSHSQSVNLGVDLTKNANSVLSLTSGYRKTDYTNGFASVSNDESLVGRLDYSLNAFKGFINSSLYYEVGNGQEPRREITYLEVLPGQGVYAWNDYNGNGIKELNEFEISRFPDQAKYIRVFTAGTEYVRTNFTGINQSIRLTPSAILKGAKGWQKLLRKFTNQLSYKIDRKILASKGLEVYNPFNTGIDGENLVSLSSFLRNTLFFDRNNPKFGVDFNYLTDGGKSFLSNGFDSRKRHETGLRIRTTPARSANLNLTVNHGRKKYQSELFSQRNYQITYLDLLPEFNYQFNTDFRLTFLGVYGSQHNMEALGGEKNTNITFTTETRYNVLKRGVLTGKVSFINNKFKGNGNSTIGYEMLSGLQVGNNYTWGLALQRTIGNGIQLNISYEGRKSPAVNTVHTGNMQVRAYF
ncbi:hypothetical protein [Pedobacter nanyangensis]|uniref:hypothetical protein n=1 Tax=Pedobacter nanyangensis TaxID=1562389 RepID=UPI000DE3F598|nr:hypothetical protein [Pedobacter nanyangensis]